MICFCSNIDLPRKHIFWKNDTQYFQIFLKFILTICCVNVWKIRIIQTNAIDLRFMFFWMFFKTIFGRDVYSTTEITRLTIQREEFLVLYILICTTFLAAFLGIAPSIKCAQVHRILVKKSSIYGGCRLLKLMNLKFQSVCNFEKWPPLR